LTLYQIDAQPLKHGPVLDFLFSVPNNGSLDAQLGLG